MKYNYLCRTGESGTFDALDDSAAMVGLDRKKTVLVYRYDDDEDEYVVLHDEQDTLRYELRADLSDKKCRQILSQMLSAISGCHVDDLTTTERTLLQMASNVRPVVKIYPPAEDRITG